MLAVEALTKTFLAGTVNEMIVLRGVTFMLDSGDFAVIIGPNGAGKSILLNVISGVFPCDSGRIILNGHDITGYSEHRRARYVGRVCQDPKQGTAPSMSIEEHLAMALTRSQTRGLRWGVTNHLRERFRAALEPLGMGLERRLKARVSSLSGGERQALSLLMATLQKPALLLLDEPTASLDPQAAVRILELTEKMIEECKFTTVMVTHSMEHALRLGNRLLMMHDGRIVLDMGSEKNMLKVADLIDHFRHRAGEQFLDDHILLQT
jgi:putative ABC transport system ATP-binding protein